MRCLKGLIFSNGAREITANAVKKAFDKPTEVNVHLVEAQQARRVLDRLVGYKISPLLWDKVRRGLSAGRVQTVALRLIVERERLIRAFEKKEGIQQIPAGAGLVRSFTIVPELGSRAV